MNWNEFTFFIKDVFNKLMTLIDIDREYLTNITYDGFKALIVLVIGFIIARLLYTYIIRLFKKYNLKDKINKFEDFLESDEEIKENAGPPIITKKLTERIKIDIVVAKSVSYYIFLFFFKQSLLIIGVTGVADSLKELLEYLPSLFVGIVIGFFGIRFANFIYDVTYHTLSIAEAKSQNKTSKIIATGSKGLILFLTFTLVLNFTKIVEKEMIYIILIGFISMLSIAGGLAFGLGGKEMARDILQKFNSDDEAKPTYKEIKKEAQKNIFKKFHNKD